MATACDVAWSHFDSEEVVPLLQLNAHASTWALAMEVRNHFLALFDMDPPFFPLPDEPRAREAVLDMVKRAKEQVAEQAYGNSRDWRDGRPTPDVLRRFRNTLMGRDGPERPFCAVRWSYSCYGEGCSASARVERLGGCEVWLFKARIELTALLASSSCAVLFVTQR